MKIHEKNEIFHEMGIKYLSQLFQFIKINQKKLTNEKNKEKKGNINKDDNKDNDIKDMDIEEQQKIKNENDNNNEIKEEIKSNFGNDENSIGFSENSSQNNNEILENVNEEISANEGEEEEEEEEENEENEDLVDEEYDEDEEILPEQILAQNNAEEDLFSLMRSEEDDSLENEENEDINDIESFHLNNINFDLINNDELDEENNELNERENNFNPEEFINRLELALGLNPSQNNNNNNQNQNEVNINNNNNNLVINNNQNYNEENILFYNPFIESASSMNKSQAKSEVNIFYEEFIIFPFLVLRTKSKNNLIYFNRPNISIDIFSNLDKSIVIKTSSMFLYNYLFPFDLNYERYFHFILIGAKEKTVKAYFEELNKIMKDFFSMYSMHDLTLIENSIKIIKKKLIKKKKRKRKRKRINWKILKTKIMN